MTRTVTSLMQLGLLLAVASGSPASAQSRDAEPSTRDVNAAFATTLPSADRSDFEDANRGFIATISGGVIAGPRGPAFDTNAYKFLQQDAVPATVNPSL